jgi:hypothetical protein
MSRKPADLVKLNLRFAEALRARLEKQASKNNTSLNAEIVRRLEQSLARDIERTREKTQIERNSQALELMLGGNEAATYLLQKIIFELQRHPEWDGNKADRKAIADKVHAFIYPPEIFEGATQ